MHRHANQKRTPEFLQSSRILMKGNCNNNNNKNNKTHLQCIWPWPTWLSWWECHLINRRITGSIPGQGTGLGAGSAPSWGPNKRQQSDASLLHWCFSSFLLTLPTFSVSMKKTKQNKTNPSSISSSESIYCIYLFILGDPFNVSILQSTTYLPKNLQD